MWLDKIFIPEDTSNALFEKLERYNAAHSEQLTAQEFSEKLLTYCLNYLDTDQITLD